MTALYVALAAGVVTLILAPSAVLAVLRVVGSLPWWRSPTYSSAAATGVRVAVPAGPTRSTWYAELFIIAPSGRRVRIRAGMVRGAWTTRLDIERELLARWLAVHGRPKAGRLAARAERRA